MSNSETDFERKYEARTSETLKRWGVIIGIAAGIVGLMGAYITLPQRLDSLEKQVEKLKQDRETDHDILTHISARIELLKKP